MMDPFCLDHHPKRTLLTRKASLADIQWESFADKYRVADFGDGLPGPNAALNDGVWSTADLCQVSAGRG